MAVDPVPASSDTVLESGFGATEAAPPSERGGARTEPGFRPSSGAPGGPQSEPPQPTMKSATRRDAAIRRASTVALLFPAYRDQAICPSRTCASLDSDSSIF